jgi:hypothetical protein
MLFTLPRAGPGRALAGTRRFGGEERRMHNETRLGNTEVETFKIHPFISSHLKNCIKPLNRNGNYLYHLLY